jgi:hypothetical protein
MQNQVTPKSLLKGKDVEISITLKEVINSNEGLQALSREELPVMLAYKISKTLKTLDTAVEAFSNGRKAILDSKGTLDKETGRYTFEGENEKLAEDEVNALLDEVKSFTIYPIDIEELEEAGMKLEARTLALLDWFVIG